MSHVIRTPLSRSKDQKSTCMGAWAYVAASAQHVIIIIVQGGLKPKREAELPEFAHFSH